MQDFNRKEAIAQFTFIGKNAANYDSAEQLTHAVYTALNVSTPELDKVKLGNFQKVNRSCCVETFNEMRDQAQLAIALQEKMNVASRLIDFDSKSILTNSHIIEQLKEQNAAIKHQRDMLANAISDMAIKTKLFIDTDLSGPQIVMACDQTADKELKDEK